MGTTTNEGARVDYKARSKAMLEDCYQIAESSLSAAKEIATSGEDVRGNEDRPGVSTLMHVAEKAIGEIVRLTPMCGEMINSVEDNIINITYGLELPSKTATA